MKHINFFILIAITIILPNISSVAFEPPADIGPFVFPTFKYLPNSPLSFDYLVIKPEIYGNRAQFMPPPGLGYSAQDWANMRDSKKFPIEETLADHQYAEPKPSTPKSPKENVLVHEATEAVTSDIPNVLSPIDQSVIDPNQPKAVKSLDAPSIAVYKIYLKELFKLRENNLFKKFEKRFPPSKPTSDGKPYLFRFEFSNEHEFYHALSLFGKKGLQKLTLHGPWVTDHVLFVLEHYLEKANLTYLDLSYCPNITDKGLALIAKYLGDLQYLNFNFSSNITDETLNKLDIPHTKYLELENCTQITDQGFKKIASQIKALRTL